MVQKALLSISIVVCTFAYQVYATCNLDPTYSISETAPAGTVILNATKTSGTTVTFSVKNPSGGTIGQALRDHLQLIDGNTTFQLENSDVLDLEWFQLTHQEKISSITLTFSCGNQNNEVFIIVEPVNEFPPVFHNAPYNVTLNESLPIGSLVFAIMPMITDADVTGVQNFIFAINKYNIIDYDGSDYFSILATSVGNVNLAKQLDYDSMGRSSLFLNLSVADETPSSPTAKISYATLEITILDVDDQPPYFDYPNCPPPCPAPPYLAIIRLTHTGVLPIKPAVRGNDSDTLGTRLVYAIKSGNQHNLFTITPNTGSVTQVKSVNDAGLPDKEFRLVIEIRKDLPDIDLSSIAILTVKVYERMTNTSGVSPPPTGRSTEDTGSDLTIPLVVLGVFLAIVIVLLIVIFILYRRKLKEMSVRPADDKSEPQTEEEDLPTDGETHTGRADSNERLIFGNKATLGIMTEDFPETSGVKANPLPPLPMRDTGTETTEGKRKKKSRRRNKNKAVEIFDGTREYNMGADPEFFDSTDKSRVKRSYRSKKVDSPLPIQVPNDNFTDTESVHM